MQTRLSLSEPKLGTYSSQSLTAPLPVVGFRGEYGINDRWTLRGAFQWFGITVSDLSGHFTERTLASIAASASALRSGSRTTPSR